MKFRKQSKLGKAICIRLIELDRNKKWLAKEARIQECLISKYCVGEVIPTIRNLTKISKVLDISVGTLAKLLEEKENNKAV